MVNDKSSELGLNDSVHKPVMLKEVMEQLDLKPGKVIVDCTVGGGGHSRKILDAILPGGFLIGLDKDEDELRKTYDSFVAEYGGGAEGPNEQHDDKFAFYQTDFINFDEAISRAGKSRVDGVLIDLGVSSMQLETPDRGFSFNREGPLDMRMDRSVNFTAFDLLKNIKQKELERIIRQYGEERFAGRIARAVVERRRKLGCPKTTTELAQLIKSAVPFIPKRIHPATLTFQALRIYVNKELDSLEKFLNSVDKYLNDGGRVVVISFHSLEDRIVKNVFRDKSKHDLFNILTPKPLIATSEEVRDNPRARSAKLRASERVVI